MTIKELINQYVTAHADNRWMDASDLEALLTEFAEKLKEPASEDLRKAEMDWLSPQLDKYYAVYGERKMMELTHFDGYAMLDAIEFGAQWQREQMMKDAVDGEVTGIGPLINGQVLDTQKQIRRLSSTYSFGNSPYCEIGDKVKVIIIKE